jgi:FkbM family methyltransferase
MTATRDIGWLKKTIILQLSAISKKIGFKLGLHIAKRHHYPPYTLMGLDRTSIRTIFDVGANAGQFAKSIRRLIPNAHLYCFEPTESAFEALAKWASTTPDVHAERLALGEQSGVVAMNVHTGHSTSSSLLETTRHCHDLYPITAQQATLHVQMERLDSFVARLPSEPSAEILIKLDVQGYETNVLRGAPKTLERTKACIVEVSVDELYEGQSRFEEIVSLMSAAGLSFAGNFDQLYDRDGHVVSMDCFFLRSAARRSTICRAENKK